MSEWREARPGDPGDDVWAVLLAYDSADFLAGTLDAVTAAFRPDRVVLMDNGSTDGTSELVRTRYPDVHLMSIHPNVGYSRACNVAMKWVMDRGARFLFQINDDALVTPEAIAKLVDVARRRPEYALLAPVNRSTPDGPVDPTFLSELLRFGIGDVVADALLARREEVYDVPAVPGAVLLVRTAFLRERGGLDPIFFVYGCEYDLCRRTAGSEWKVGLVPDAVVVHDYERPLPASIGGRIRRAVHDSYYIGLIWAKRPGRPFWVAAMESLSISFFRFQLAFSRGRLAEAAGVVLAVPKLALAFPRVRRHRRILREDPAAFLERGEPHAILPELPRPSAAGVPGVTDR